MNVKRIGMVTIGQSPRTDVVPEIREILGTDIEIMEGGALDGLSLAEVREFYPQTGDYMLCTRMADGAEVVVGKKHILPRMRQCISRLVGTGAEAILLLCTGKFPEFPCERLLVEPQRVLDHFVLALQGRDQRLGLMIPLQGQMEQARKKYSRVKGEIIIQAASPYAKKDEVERAAKALKKADPHLIVMHCMGYTQAMKDRVREITGKPVVLARSLVARTLKELVG